MKNKGPLLKYGRILLFIPAPLYTFLILFVIGIMLRSGGDEFMLTKQYPHVAEDFLHTMKSNLITSLGVGLFFLTILKFAFKPGERWTWFIMWILPLSVIEEFLYGISKGFGFEYLFGGLILLVVLGLLISYRAFFPGR